MATRAASIPSTASSLEPDRAAYGILLFGAPFVAVLAGMSAEWLDFRALRVPLLLLVGFGVLATAYAAGGARGGWRSFAMTVLLGAATWAAAQSVYAIIHVASGERFHAERFGPQWSQAILLIAAHGAFLGTPTGLAAAIILRIPVLRERASRA